MNSIVGLQGRIILSAQGCTRSTQVQLEISEVMRTLLGLRLLAQHAHDEEEEDLIASMCRIISSHQSSSVTSHHQSSNIIKHHQSSAVRAGGGLAFIAFRPAPDF